MICDPGCGLGVVTFGPGCPPGMSTGMNEMEKESNIKTKPPDDTMMILLSLFSFQHKAHPQ